MSKLEVVILAAGQGTRMKSRLPKVLHRLGGRPLLAHAIDTARRLNPNACHVVFGHGGELVPEAIGEPTIDWVLQAEQLGTGHAVDQAMARVDDDAVVLVLYGDVPLIREQTLRRTIECVSAQSMGLLTIELDDAGGYGRIVRDDSGAVVGIVEHKDAGTDQLAIREINTGILAVDGARLRGWLKCLDADNVQGEYYLTDIVALAVADGVRVRTVSPENAAEVMGINDRVQLAHLEREYQRLQAEHWMRAGVTLRDPARVDFRGDINIAEDCEIDVNVVLQGRVVIGRGVVIGANVHITDTTVGDGTVILPNCVFEDAIIGPQCRVGPFSRLRPGAVLKGNNHVGNFVEIKNSDVGSRSKVNHLTYLGDSEVGEEVNVGAGTITCNYDGANKHKTVIGDRAFIGSGVELVAPIVIGVGATVGAGSTLSKNAPPEKLTLTRVKQMTANHWHRPKKKPKA